LKHFERGKATRGRLIMACATGKTLIALWIARMLKAKRILVAMPSLQLIKQGVEDWTREFLAHGEKPDWMCVCSDRTVGDLDGKNVDEFVTYAYESGLPTESDSKDIANRLRARANETQIVFTTYQSGKIMAEAARRAGVTFDFAIFDEAHRTAGKRNKPFARLLRDSSKAKRRMFMTATERVVSGDRDEVYSMGDEQFYGKRFHYLSLEKRSRKSSSRRSQSC